MDAGRTTRVVGMVTALLVAMVAPSGAATSAVNSDRGGPVDPDPGDVLLKVLNLTLAYVEDFDPNDNATTMKSNSEMFVGDLLEVVGEYLCLHFDEGLDLSWIGIPNVLKREFQVLGYGYDEESHREGIGVLTIRVLLSGVCSTLVREPSGMVEYEAGMGNEVEGVVRSAERSFSSSSPWFS